MQVLLKTTTMRMELQIVTVFVTLLACTGAEQSVYDPDVLIYYINNRANANWKAGHNFEGVSMSYVKGLRSGVISSQSLLRERNHDLSAREIIPETFDARFKWPNCDTIKEVRDQGACGSSWAIAAVEAMSDRICIASKGKVNAHLSVENLLTCCSSCGFGCYGGYPEAAWQYYTTHGIVTGGQYGTNEGCQPNPFLPCSHHMIGEDRPLCKSNAPTPSCKKTCTNGYATSYMDDLYFGKSAYSVPQDEEQIQMELMNSGPIEASFTLYADFPNYKSGVYHHVAGGALGGHAVKIIGWGVDNGVNYWLVANSWNSDWGDNGFFKIRRGTDECGIESSLVAGEPRIK